MKYRLFVAAALCCLGSSLVQAQAGYTPYPDHPVGTAAAAPAGKHVSTPNYALAERFTAKKVRNMVFSTRVTPEWFPSGEKFWYSWKTSEGTNYYIVDPKTGKKDEVFDLDKLAMELTEKVRDPFDARHIPLDGLKLRDDNTFEFDIRSTMDIKDPDDSTKTTKKVFHFLYDISSRKLTETAEKKDKWPRWANVSPDGTMGIYMKGGDLYYMDSTSLRKAAGDDTTFVEHRLTRDAIRGFDWSGDNYSGNFEEDTTRRELVYSALWSPDSKHFAVVKWDMRPVKELWVINSVSQPRPTLETYKYQMPGEPGPVGSLWVFDMPSGEHHEVASHAFKDQDLSIYGAPSTAADNYVDYRSRRWLGDENGFYVSRMSRDLKRYDLCYVPVGGDSTHVVIKERLNTYVETREPRLAKGGSQIIEWSERNGWANLYLYSSDGKLIRNLTEGAYHVEDVLGINESAGYVLFSACGMEPDENPYQMHTYKVALSGGTPRRLDMEDMDVLSVCDDKARWFVANYSRVDAAPAVALFDAASGRRTDLEKADFSLLYAAGYQFPERFRVKAADGVTDLYGAIYKPYDFDSTMVYPVCDYVYPGPQVEANNISWTRPTPRTDRLAQLGYIVITVGNRGGHPNRSKWYHNFGYGNLRDYGLEDQKYAIQQLCAMHPYMDPSRVGIHGHSGGGFMSTAAILTYPDFFRAAVSCSGNHDNSIYNRWWSEQHHGILEKIDKGDTTFVYHIDTNQELARNLKGHLMLVTGDIDNNVHPANTIRVVNALINANKRFDLLVLPGQRHGYGDMDEYFFWKLADFYSEWLMGSSERGEVDIREMNND